MSITMERTVKGTMNVTEAFDYLADFTTTTEWDPGSVSTERLSGNGGPGTEYHNVSRFAGRTSEVHYTVVELDPGRQIVLKGTNRSVELRDTITVRPVGTGCEVTYRVEFTFKGFLALASPFLRPAVRKLVDEGAQGLEKALNR